MCNCNSSFCAVCCRRVKAYRFDNVPEITGDLQLYTEFYKVGEAYGHWKFTVDDLEAYLDIPTVLWNDKLVAFGHTATGGLFYDSAFIWNYTDSALTIGTRDIGAEGLYSFTIGNKIELGEIGLKNPAFNQRKPFIELIDDGKSYKLTSEGIEEGAQ